MRPETKFQVDRSKIAPCSAEPTQNVRFELHKRLVCVLVIWRRARLHGVPKMKELTNRVSDQNKRIRSVDNHELWGKTLKNHSKWGAFFFCCSILIFFPNSPVLSLPADKVEGKANSPSPIPNALMLHAALPLFSVWEHKTLRAFHPNETLADASATEMSH